MKYPILKVAIWGETFWDGKLKAKVVPWARGHYVGYVYIFEAEPERNRLVYLAPHDNGGSIYIHVTGPVAYTVSGMNSIMVDPDLHVDPKNDQKVESIEDLDF